MNIKKHKLPLLIMLIFLPLFSQTWEDDSLVIRQILDTNGLHSVPVDSVIVKKDSTGRASWLIISKLPSFKVFPASIMQLEKLVRLNISHTNLVSIPSEIGELTLLIILDLYDNKLTYLPPEIGDIDSLLRLNISRNALTSLPPEIGNLKKMYSFQCQNNKITGIPDEICDIDSLISISAEHNLISYIPEDIGYMPVFEGINLEYNMLKHFPNSLIPYSPDDVRVCYNDSLVFTEEQKAAWNVKDYDDFFWKYCSVEVKEEVVQNQPENSPIHINPHAILLRINCTGHSTCSVYNLCGRKIETLVSGVLSAGTHTISWNRARYAPGIYFVLYSAVGGHSSVKTVIVK